MTKSSFNSTYNFHISRAARARYSVDDSLFSLRGTVVFANFYSARLLAQQMNRARGADGGVQAGELNALGLIHEILHAVLQQYRRQHVNVMTDAVQTLYQNVGPAAVETTLQKFVDEFPPLPVYRGQQTIEQYLNGSSDGIANREIVLEEMILVWLENQNPAASPFKELFDDSALAQSTAYTRIVQNLREFFAVREPVGASGQTLFEALRAPFVNAPESLSAQLDYMLYRWAAVAGALDLSPFFSRVLGGLQLIQEEQQFLWTQATQPFGGGGFTATTPPVPFFRREFEMRVDAETGKEIWYEPEPEQFSPDLDWMPNLVLLAKSTYVWLDQLSKKYRREITRLDQIPDAELDELRRRGITGLWFIGVWERSPASARIKHMLGNTGAIASAYSLYDYQIADELGGAEALQQLKDRAWVRGIRLASDMVPNHMGIDSKWVIEHPEWFIQSATPPYPSYSYQGADLTSRPDVTIQIEDHYWDRSDAAVVFKRTDHANADVRYIYHGNDGTTFPWNDTAQLNYLLPEVREQVIKTILSVARQTPVIRFDAAMTLAKKHFQRLWYPLPGEKDTIPSRSEYTMTKAEFDAAMPEEFWREVVDRVAAEAPDTLLLAEAFWLMEGFFVRTLGMHRVYNSAFMHMLRDEKNQEYRLVIKNTIEFDPEVLKRYVNFMNNPDERTAEDQFGKGDKYFGVSAMMATLPGLPMFGHGQFEGLTERYGMEFRRAMLDETPDQWLIERHQREIFPLLHKRYLFAGVENFLLYDVFRANGKVDENVFAYSNRIGNQAALFTYNNSYTEARGTIRTSAAYLDKAQQVLVQRTLAEGLNVPDDENVYLIFRDHVSGLEFIRRTSDIVRDGFEIALGAYKYAVYLDFRQVTDTPEKLYATLRDGLRGRGVPSVDQAIRDIHLAPLYAAFREMVNGESLRTVREVQVPGTEQALPAIVEKAVAFAQVVHESGVKDVDANAFAESVERNLNAVRELNQLAPPARASAPLRAAVQDIQTQLDDSMRDGLAAFAFLHAMETLAPADPAASDGERGAQVAVWIDEWRLGTMLGDALRATEVEDARIWQLIMLIKIALQQHDTASAEALLNDPNVASFLNVNRFEDVLWFNKEQFGVLTNWLQVVGAMKVFGAETTAAKENAALVQQHAQWIAWRSAEAQSEYRMDRLLAALAPPEPVKRVPAGRNGLSGEPVARPEPTASARRGSAVKKQAVQVRKPVKASAKPAAKPATSSKPQAPKSVLKKGGAKKNSVPPKAARKANKK